MALNTELLRDLVTWAATENIKRENPDKAVELGLMKPGTEVKGVKWDQGRWANAQRNGTCQTAFCIAGHAAHLAKDQYTVMMYAGTGWDGVRTYEGEHLIDISVLPKELPRGVEVDKAFKVMWVEEASLYDLPDSDEFAETVHEYMRDIGDVGAEELGLDYMESDSLFSGSNEIEDVVAIAVAIAKAHDEDLGLPEWVTEEYLYEEQVEKVNL